VRAARPVGAGSGLAATSSESIAALRLAYKRSPAPVKDDQTYYDRLQMYKGEKTPEDLLRSGGDAVTVATLAYGVGNWYLYTGGEDEAKAVFERIVTGPNWMPFGFIAAEAELARMRK